MAQTAFTLKGVNRLKLLLTPGHSKPIVMRHVGRATGRNALWLLREIRKGIQAGKFDANAPLTEAIKGSGKPLVDKGELFKSIAMHQQSPTVAFVGILKTDKAYNLGVALHEGFTVDVTKRMRGLFFVLWLASIGAIPAGDLTGRAADLFQKYKSWKPLGDKTTAIRVKPRRFIADVFNQKGVQKRIVTNWKNALREGMMEASKQ